MPSAAFPPPVAPAIPATSVPVEKQSAEESRYRRLLEAAPDAMVVVNQRGDIVLVNLQAEKQFGYRRDELLGQKVKNIIPEGFAERLIADDLRSREDALAQQIGTGIELTARRKDGSAFPIEIMLSPLESAEGILVTAAIRDLSARKAAERHLVQMEGRYRGLLEAAPDAMVVVNQGGDIVLLNLQAEKQFGYRRDELLGQRVTNIIPEGFAERLIADDLRSAEDALAQQIGTGIELTARRKDGSAFPIELMLSPLESAEGILVTAAIRDISVRKAAELHLVQMEGRYRGLLEAAPDAMVVVNQRGDIVLVNLQSEKQFGYRRDELLGQKVENIIPEGFAERLIADDLRSPEDALAQQIGTGIELTARRKDGSAFPIELMLSPLESAEGILVTAAIRDISARKAAERHLVQMEGRYRGLLEAAPDAMVVVNQGGDIVLLNLQAEKQFAYRRDELLGQPVTNIIPEGFAERLLADDLRSPEDALAQQIGTGIELTARRKDGSTFPIEIMLSPLENAEGTLITAAIRDIGERKRAELALKRSELRYQLALQGMSVGLWDWDLVTNELVWSPRFKEIIGVTNAEFVPNDDEFESRLHPEDKERTVAMLQAHARNEGPYDVECRLRRNDGEYAWIHATGQAAWDASGNPLRMVGSVDDITQRKQAEERFRLVVESAPYPMLMINQGGDIVLVNMQTEKLFGYRREELLGQKVETLLPERFREGHPGQRSGYFTSTGVEPEMQSMAAGRDVYALRKDGSECPVEISLIPIRTDQGLLVLNAIVDITERKLLEQKNRKFNELLENLVADRTAQLKAANKELDDFANAASHDLKAPLRVIDNASKWLEEDLREHLTDASRKSLRLMRGRVGRMEKLLDDLLEYSRIGRTMDEKDAEMINGDALMENIVTLLSPPEGFNVQVGAGFASSQLRRMPLQQILMNLVSNAIKHHDKKTGCIQVSVKDCGTMYKFAVKDDGPGIPARFHEQVFKMFHTLKSRDQVKGSGMGLAMVRKHVEAFGGTLALQSSEGKGSVFSFTWPINTADAARKYKNDPRY